MTYILDATADTLLHLKELAAQQSQWTIAVLVFFGTLALLACKSWWDERSAAKDAEEQSQIGDITLEELQRYTGRDPFLPILMAVRGAVYDVTKGKDFYGPGGGYEKFAGREVARALAIMSLKDADLTDDLSDVTEKQRETLADWEKKFKEKYGIVGKICPPLELTLEELHKYDGSNPKLPIYLAIKGTIFDVSKGRQFYGPDGIYPFAGRECARAFALLSTNTEDCNDNLEGLEAMEMDHLRDWQSKFYSKYKLVGNVVPKKSQN